MRFLKEQPLLLCWLVALTAACVYLFFHINVNVQVTVHTPQDASVTSSRSVQTK